MDFSPTLDQLRAVGEETRLRILVLLHHSDLTVTELVRCLGQLQPRVSRHLKILVQANLVAPYQEGAWRFYRLADLPTWLGDVIGPLQGDQLEADQGALQDVRADRAAKAQAYFAANAEMWDALRRLHTDEGDIERALLDLAPSRIDRFLDLGTGTGRMLSLFSDRYADGVGYDASPEMLAMARVRLDEAGLRSVTLRRRDILKPDQIAAKSADVVCFHHVLHFLAEPERAVMVASEALRAGGTLLIADFAPHAREELRENHAHRRLGFGTEEMSNYAHRAGLELVAERALKTNTDDDLVSMIWRFDKQTTCNAPRERGAAHA